MEIQEVLNINNNGAIETLSSTHNTKHHCTDHVYHKYFQKNEGLHTLVCLQEARLGFWMLNFLSTLSFTEKWVPIVTCKVSRPEPLEWCWWTCSLVSLQDLGSFKMRHCPNYWGLQWLQDLSYHGKKSQKNCVPLLTDGFGTSKGNQISLCGF